MVRRWFHKLEIHNLGRAKVTGKCSCGKWQMTGYETSVRNTHRIHKAEEAKKN